MKRRIIHLFHMATSFFRSLFVVPAVPGPLGVFVKTMKQNLTAEDIDTHIEGCIGCGVCAAACPLYMATQDPQHHPKRRSDELRKIYRMFFTFVGRLKTILKMAKFPAGEDLKKLSDLVFGVHGCCTMCGRCTLACSQGVRNNRLVELTRAALTAAGIVPPVVQEILTNSRTTGHSFGKTWDETVGRAVQMAREAGVKVTVDRKGAKYLLPCSSIGNTLHPEVLTFAGEVLNVAGVDFTVSSRLKNTGTEEATFCVDMPLALSYAEEMCAEAVRLGCKYIIVGECACDVRWLSVEAAEVFTKHGVELVYIDALLLDRANQGKLPLKNLGEVVTLHDPCWTVRKAGYGDVVRGLLQKCATLIEMTPNREHTYCCGAGGGGIRMWPDSTDPENIRMNVSAFKAEQIRQTGVSAVVTPCATCWRSLDQIVEHHNVPAKTDMLMMLVYRAMMAALSRKAVQEPEPAVALAA